MKNPKFQLFASFIAMMMIGNLQYTWTLFVEPLRKGSGWERTQITAAYTIYIALQTWVQPQRAAESFQRGDGVVLQHVALSHARRRGEVIGVDFERLMAVANRRVVLAQVIVRGAALAPGFGYPR